MPDQVNSIIRDSDIKFECRLLIATLGAIPVTYRDLLLSHVQKIIQLENARLDKLKET